jgi:hypothetical protein
MNLALATTILPAICYFASLKLMSGTANHSIALAQSGLWQCFIVDTLYSADHNLLSASFQALIISLIRRRLFHAVHIELDCRSWSRLANPR